MRFRTDALARKAASDAEAASGRRRTRRRWRRSPRTRKPSSARRRGVGPEEPLAHERVRRAPRAGEIRVKVISNALCHTDIYTLDGHDPEGLFPHPGPGRAPSWSVGKGVTSVRVATTSSRATPQCNAPSCIFCASPKTNLCPTIRTTQGAGYMPDGTTRFTARKDGKDVPVFHFMGCSTFAEYTVIAEISAAKINKRMPLNKACLFGCGVSTGLGAVWNTCKVEEGRWRCSGWAPSGWRWCRRRRWGRRARHGVDLNKASSAWRLSWGHGLGALGSRPVQQVIAAGSPVGCGLPFDCTGNVT